MLLAINLSAQEKYELSENYKNISFKDFVTRVETKIAVKFFYKDEWVNDLKLGDYQNCTKLSCILDNLFKGTTLYYFIEESGNIVITNNYAVKVSITPIEKDNNFIQFENASGFGENEKIAGNEPVEIGNPAEKNKHGTVIVSGYITNKDNKEPIPGVTVFNKKLAIGSSSNEFGYYTLTLPRGNHLLGGLLPEIHCTP